MWRRVLQRPTLACQSGVVRPLSSLHSSRVAWQTAPLNYCPCSERHLCPSQAPTCASSGPHVSPLSFQTRARGGWPAESVSASCGGDFDDASCISTDRRAYDFQQGPWPVPGTTIDGLVARRAITALLNVSSHICEHSVPRQGERQGPVLGDLVIDRACRRRQALVLPFFTAHGASTASAEYLRRLKACASISSRAGCAPS